MKVNEIFYSIQGEGFNAGKAAIFIRLAGCNLRCPFCDTDFSKSTEKTDEEIIDEISKYPCRFIVITGGEPSLQLTSSSVKSLHKKGYYVAVESNGTRELPKNVDWVTISPKDDYEKSGKTVVKVADEVKVVFDKEHQDVDKFLDIVAKHYYLQPCDTGNVDENREIYKEIVNYVKHHNTWSISLQQQKILNIR